MRAIKAFISVSAIAAFLTGILGCSHSSNEGKSRVANIPKKEIRDLSSAINNARKYRMEKRVRLDLMEDTLASAATDKERCKANLSIARAFRSFNTDSAIYYANRAQWIALQIGESECINESRIAIVDALSTAGLFTEASDVFHSINPDSLIPATKIDYWIAGRRLYGYMKGYVLRNQDWYTRYDNAYMQYDDSLLLHLPRESQFRAFLECERMVRNKEFFHAQHSLERLISRLSPDSNLYGMATFQMAEVWKNLGDTNRYAAYLALSALSDVEGCVTEGMALPTLADWLYEQGEFNDAFAFINFALEEASSANARMRAVTIAQFVPIIDEAYRDKINTSRNELLIYFILVTLLLIITATLIIFLTRQIKKSKANSTKLEQTSRRQESYIGNFIGLYSSYAERFTKLTKLVSTKLAAGQGAELKKLIDSGKYSDQENNDIHKIFDSAFLDIYPDFISKINSLLRPEEAIEVKIPGSLTPELRIYAIVKLVVDESTRIAQILHYSINTVYTYRNKMRNKAIERDTFDTDVKNL